MHRLILVLGTLMVPDIAVAQDMPYLDAANSYIGTEAINAGIDRAGKRKESGAKSGQTANYDVVANTECFRARSREKHRAEFDRREREQGIEAATQWLRTIVPAEERKNRALVAARTPC